MYKVILFSRHDFTPAQEDEISAARDALLEKGLHCEITPLRGLATRNIASVEEAKAILDEILAIIGRNHAYLYGVVPVPLRSEMERRTYPDRVGWTLTVMEAFNVNRSKEGEKPSFEHAGFLRTGYYAF